MKTQRTLLVLASYIFLALYIVRATMFVDQTRADLALSLGICIVVTLACIADSKVIRRPMSHAAKWVMLLTWLVAVPIYLLWSRGTKGFIPLLIHLVVFGALLIGVPFLLVGIAGLQPR